MSNCLDVDIHVALLARRIADLLANATYQPPPETRRVLAQLVEALDAIFENSDKDAT